MQLLSSAHGGDSDSDRRVYSDLDRAGPRGVTRTRSALLINLNKIEPEGAPVPLVFKLVVLGSSVAWRGAAPGTASLSGILLVAAARRHLAYPLARFGFTLGTMDRTLVVLECQGGSPPVCTLCTPL